MVAELNQELAAWESQMIPPRWNQQFPLRPDGRPLFGSLLKNGNAETRATRQALARAWYRSKTGVKWSTARSVSPTHSLCIDRRSGGETGGCRMAFRRRQGGARHGLHIELVLAVYRRQERFGPDFAS